MIARAAGCLGLWLVLAGGWGDLAVGVAAAGLGAWASLRIAPPGAGAGLRPAALGRLLLRLPGEVLGAGWAVARLALDPRRAPPAPGLVAYAPTLPPGPARDAFLALSSLLPGTLPAREAPGGVVAIHALDTGAPIAAAMAAEEARFRAVLDDG